MSLRLADDEIVLTIGAETICLRPSLRAAARLNHKFGGLDALLLKIAEDHFGALSDVIREASSARHDLAFLLSAPNSPPLYKLFETFRNPVISLVLAMSGHDPDAKDTRPADEHKISFAELFDRLFAMATGILGWNAQDAWNATPNEIMAAVKGRMTFVGDVLKAIFGKTDSTGDKASGPDRNGTLDRAGLAELKALSARMRAQ